MENITGKNNTNLQNSDGHTAREEAEGKDIWEKLQSKNLNCEDLSDDDFGVLGEYFMGQMMGDSHEAMNNMMIQRMGEEGEEQMHIAMGKRMSNCEPDASVPQNMPALSGVEGMNSGMMGGGMMGWNNWGLGAGWGWPGWFMMISFWVLIVLGIIALIKWIIKK